MKRHSTRLSRAHDEQDDLEATAAITAEAGEVHLASDDYPEMGTILRTRPDPGRVIRVIGSRVAAAYPPLDDTWDDRQVSVPWHDSPALGPVEGDVHRGISLQLPQHVHAIVHDQSRPVHERGFALAQHLLTTRHPVPEHGQGLGYNWTNDPDLAKAHAEGHRDDARSTATPVVLHARVPDREELEDNPYVLRDRHLNAPYKGPHAPDHERDPWSFPSAESGEVSVKSGGAVPLTGISWGPAGHWYSRGSDGGYHDARDDPSYSHLDFPEGLSAMASADAYGRPDDAREHEYNGGEAGTGLLWAEPGQQDWAEEHLGPQQEAPPPPWAMLGSYDAGTFAANVMARLEQMKEASQVFGTARQEAAPPFRHAGTVINGTQVDDHGDAPGHGTVPRASDPDSYDARSTEGDGDPKWSAAPPQEKRHNNGATVGMFPEGMSSGSGPGLPIGPFTAIRMGADTGPMGAEAMAAHLAEAHGYTPDDVRLALSGYGGTAEDSDWSRARNALDGSHLADHASENFMHWEEHPHGTLSSGRRDDGGPEAPRSSLGDLAEANSLRSRWEAHHPREGGQPAPAGAPDAPGMATYRARPDSEPIDPVFGTRRVPWTDKERVTLHGWDGAPSASWGDFVNRSHFTNASPPEEAVPGSEEELVAQAAREPWEEWPVAEWHGTRPERPGYAEDTTEELRPEEWSSIATPEEHETGMAGRLDHTLSAWHPSDEEAYRWHLQEGHGWTPGHVESMEARGHRPSDMHEALHDIGSGRHSHHPEVSVPDAWRAARHEQSLSNMFGPPAESNPGKDRPTGWPLANPAGGGRTGGDPMIGIIRSAPIQPLRGPADYEHSEPARFRRMMSALDLAHPHDGDEHSLDAGPSEDDDGFPEAHDDLDSPVPSQAWPMAAAPVSEGGPAFTQGRGDGNHGRKFPPPPAPAMPAPGEEGAPGEDGEGGEDGKKKISLEISAHLGAFVAAASDPRFRFEFTAAWRDVVAKAKRIRSEGRVRITHASAGMVIGAVSGDHDVYETGIQRPPGKPQTIQHWACGCPWASFHQDASLSARYAARAASRYSGRPCSHVMALQFEAQARSIHGREMTADPGVPNQELVVKSLPPWTPSGWAQTWLAPSASLHRTARLSSFDELQPHERDSVAQYHQQMTEEGNAHPGSTPRDYSYDSRQEPKDDFLGRYMDADDEFTSQYGPGDWEAHHQETLATHPIPSYPEANRWPLIVNDENPNYVDDGYHRLHSYMRDGATHVPTIRMHRTATPDEARDHEWTPEDRDAWDDSAAREATAALLAAGEDRDGVDALRALAGLAPSRHQAVSQTELDWYARSRAGRDRRQEDRRDSQRTGRGWETELVPNPHFVASDARPEGGVTHLMRGYMNGSPAGVIGAGASNNQQAWKLHNVHVLPEHRGQGVGEAMMDSFYDHVKDLGGRWIDHGRKAGHDDDLWQHYSEPHPEMSIHNSDPSSGWNRYFTNSRVHRDMLANASDFPGTSPKPDWDSSRDNYFSVNERWTKARGLDVDPRQGEWPEHPVNGFAGLREWPGRAIRPEAGIFLTADQANAPWGSSNVAQRPPGKPYGATSPPDKDQDPGSYGPLAGPDPENWGGIQDDSVFQMPLTTGSVRPVPGDLHWPDMAGWEPVVHEDQESYPYSDRSNMAGPSTSISPRDPNGIRMEEAIHSKESHNDGMEAHPDSPMSIPGMESHLVDEHGFTPVDIDAATFRSPSWNHYWDRLNEAHNHAHERPGYRPSDRLEDPDSFFRSAELRDEPEPALPSTTGDDIEATASQLPGCPVRDRPEASGSVRDRFRAMFGGGSMGDLARETFPQAQQGNSAGQEPGTGSFDEPLSPDNPSIQTTGNQWSGGGADSDETDVEPGQPQGSVDDIVASFQRSAAANSYAGDGPRGGGPVADGDIAAAARQFLSKTADVLPEKEAAELIDEGRGQRARNLGLLKLEGTHYEEEDDDLARRGVSLDDYEDDVISV